MSALTFMSRRAAESPHAGDYREANAARLLREALNFVQDAKGDGKIPEGWADRIDDFKSELSLATRT